MRDQKIEILRFIGISLIILAHTSPPKWIFQLRNFDVPLMVIVSGLSYIKSDTNISYLSYFWKRIKRLVFPVWIFLSIYFLAIWATGIEIETLSLNLLIYSYLMSGGIGYIWIIKVFLIIALCAPFIHFVSNKIKSNKLYLMLILLFFCLNEAALYFFKDTFILVYKEKIILHLLFDIVYSLFFAFGIRLIKLTSKEILGVFIFSILSFLIIGYFLYIINGDFIPTQMYKYPPSMYFFSYSLVASILTWLCIYCRYNNLFLYVFSNKTVFFISKNTIWIYLWHIPCVKVFVFYSIISDIFIVNYIVIYFTACTITYFQVSLINNYVIPKIKNELLIKNIRLFLTG